MPTINDYITALGRCIEFAAAWSTYTPEQKLTALRYYKRMYQLAKSPHIQVFRTACRQGQVVDHLYDKLISEHSDDAINLLCRQP